MGRLWRPGRRYGTSGRAPYRIIYRYVDDTGVVAFLDSSSDSMLAAVDPNLYRESPLPAATRNNTNPTNMTSRALLVRPIENSYVVPGAALAAGEYPGSPPGTPDSRLDAKLARFLDSGISAFIDLTDPADGLEPYAPALRSLAERRGIEAVHEHLTIRDMDICDATHMHHVLDVMDGHLAANRGVYVHCWAGIGRTGMVVGCWLVRHGRSGEDALSEVDTLFRTMSPKKVSWHEGWGSPQTEPQRIMVRTWAESETA